MDDARRQLSSISIVTASALGLYAALIAVAPSASWRLALSIPPVSIAALWWIIQTPSRWLALFFFSAILLPPIDLPFGNSGPHPAIVIAALGVFVGLLYLKQWRTH